MRIRYVCVGPLRYVRASAQPFASRTHAISIHSPRERFTTFYPFGPLLSSYFFSTILRLFSSREGSPSNYSKSSKFHVALQSARSRRVFRMRVHYIFRKRTAQDFNYSRQGRSGKLLSRVTKIHNDFLKHSNAIQRFHQF